MLEERFEVQSARNGPIVRALATLISADHRTWYIDGVQVTRKDPEKQNARYIHVGTHSAVVIHGLHDTDYGIESNSQHTSVPGMVPA